MTLFKSESESEFKKTWYILIHTYNDNDKKIKVVVASLQTYSRYIQVKVAWVAQAAWPGTASQYTIYVHKHT